MSGAQTFIQEITVKKPHYQTMILRPGSVVLVQDPTLLDFYCGVIIAITGLEAELTFVPVGRPRAVELRLIETRAANDIPDFMNLPEIQPAPTELPRMRKRRKDQPEPQQNPDIDLSELVF